MKSMKDQEKHNATLSQRHSSEKVFHDNKYGEKGHYPSHYRLSPTYFIFQRLKQIMGDIHGKKILEYGCGEGWTTIELAMLGGEIDSFDISSVAIDHAKKLLDKKRIHTKYRFCKMAAEKLDYSDECFDIVVGFAILHHLDLGLAIPEMHRVMKNGSVAYFAEPLGSNPLINAYRRLTPQYRTADEKPLILEEFKKKTQIFKKFDHSEFYLTALLPLGLSYLHLPVGLVQKMIKLFIKIDKRFLIRCPSLGKYAWYTIIRLEK